MVASKQNGHALGQLVRVSTLSNVRTFRDSYDGGMAIVEKLTPGSPLWAECTGWVQEVLLGIDKRPKYERGRHEIASGVSRWPGLHDALKEYVKYQLGHSEPWTQEDSWELLRSVIEGAQPTLESRDFYAARVLLNLVEAPSLDAPIPGDAPAGGETLALLQKNSGDIAKKAEFSTSITLRKAHLLGLYNRKAVGSFKAEGLIMREISAALFAAMLESIDRVKDERHLAFGLDVSEATIAGGWGPHRATYSYKDGSPYVTLNSCDDNPNIGDERCFVALRQIPVPGWDIPNVWQNDVWAKKDEEYFVRVYVRNGCDTDSSAGMATRAYGVRVRIFLVTERDRAAVYAVVGSENATKVWDGATVHYDPGVVPELNQVGAKLENNAHPDGGALLGPEIFSQSGVQIGYEQMDGQIPAGFPYACYITVKLKMVERLLVPIGV